MWSEMKLEVRNCNRETQFSFKASWFISKPQTQNLKTFGFRNSFGVVIFENPDNDLDTKQNGISWQRNAFYDNQRIFCSCFEKAILKPKNAFQKWLLKSHVWDFCCWDYSPGTNNAVKVSSETKKLYKYSMDLGKLLGFTSDIQMVCEIHKLECPSEVGTWLCFCCHFKFRRLRPGVVGPSTCGQFVNLVLTADGRNEWCAVGGKNRGPVFSRSSWDKTVRGGAQQVPGQHIKHPSAIRCRKKDNRKYSFW